MSISAEIFDRFPDEVSTIAVDKAGELNGQAATEVVVNLLNGKQITGTFATEARPGFGGVEFSSKKDIVALMVSKIKAVLEGRAE